MRAKTESIEADMKAKTDRMEEKFQLALEEMNKKVEKILLDVEGNISVNSSSLSTPIDLEPMP